MKNILFLLLLTSTCLFAQKDTGEAEAGSIAVNYAAFTTPSGCTSTATVIAHEINVLNPDFSIAAFAYVDLESGFTHSSDTAIVDAEANGSFTIKDATFTNYRTRVAQSCKMGCCRTAVKWTDWVYGTGDGGGPTPVIDTNDDTVPISEAGVVTIVDVTANDTSSDCEPITYTVSNEVNCTVVNNGDGTFDVTPTAVGVWNFDYTATCDDGITSGTSTVSGDAGNTSTDACTDCGDNVNIASMWITPAGLVQHTFSDTDVRINTTIYNGTGTPNNWTVDWGDGSPTVSGVWADSSSPLTFHTYSSNGLYYVTFDISNSEGETMSWGRWVQVEESGISKMQGAFGGESSLFIKCPDGTFSPDNKNFQISGSTYPNNGVEGRLYFNGILTETVPFGSGTFGVFTTPIPSTLGVTTVRIEVEDDQGNISFHEYTYTLSCAGGGGVPSIEANDDTVPISEAGVVTIVDVTANDISSDCEPITYTIESQANCTIVNNNDGTFDVTPTSAGLWGFEYTATCSDGSTNDFALVDGDASASGNLPAGSACTTTVAAAIPLLINCTNALTTYINNFNPNVYVADGFGGCSPSSNNEIIIGENYQFYFGYNTSLSFPITIDWGDGNTEQYTGSLTHAYTSTGIYNITLINDCDGATIGTMTITVI